MDGWVGLGWVELSMAVAMGMNVSPLSSTWVWSYSLKSHASQQQLVHVVVRARVGVVDDLDPNPRACSQGKVRRVHPCERRW